MSAQELALAQVAQLLDRLAIPYMVIGGQANIIWGEPRATLDIDVTVWVTDDALAGVVDDVQLTLTSCVSDPLAFVRDTRVLPLATLEGVRVDMIFALLPFEQSAIARSVTREIAGTAVHYCTAEDLILHKIFSQRPRDLGDLGDAHGVVLRQFAALDRGYLESHIDELTRELHDPEIRARWDMWVREAAAREAPLGHA